MWWFAIGIIVLYTPMAWVRSLSVWSKGYFIGIVMIVFTTLLISIFSAKNLITDGPQNEGFKPFNKDKMWSMIGFSFYSFEGIGPLLPVMLESKNPLRFPKILKYALITLVIYFTLFGLISYKYFGDMNEPIVINNMDNNNLAIKVTKLLFCVNLVFSYPITIHPTNNILESFLFAFLNPESKVRYWLSNFTRMVICFLGCFFSIMFQSRLD